MKQKAKLPTDRLTASSIKKKMSYLKGQRGTWESHWQDITDYIIPRKNNILTKRTPGEKKNFYIYDNTGIMANELLAGTLHGMLTNPNSKWFDLTTGIFELDKEDSVRKYLQEVRNRMHIVLENSNFTTEVHEMYLDLTSICTANMLMEEDEKNVVRFSTKFIADYFIDEDHRGRVNQVYHEWKWSADKIIAAFGEKNVPKKVLDCHYDGKDDRFTVVHAVYHQGLIPGHKKSVREYVSHYLLLDLEHDLKIERFFEMPYLTPRFGKAAGEIYGRGPGTTALPEIRSLNRMAEVVLKGAQKVVDPPLQLPDDGFIMPIVTSPGGLNFKRPGAGDDMIRPVFNDTRIDFGFQAMSEKRQRVRESFYVDQLKLSVDQKYMSATEVVQRTEESMRLLGPMLSRLSEEFLIPLVDRLFGIMDRKGLLPEAPDILKGRKVNVRYSSLIAKAQRISDGQAIDRTIQQALPFIQADQSVLDNINADEALRVIADLNGFPQNILRDKVEVDNLRKSRQQAQAQMQAQAQEAVNQQQVMQAMQAMPQQTQGE